MQLEQYFRDLSSELGAVQNRLRQLISDAHWPSDGAWKESVLRSILRRHLPPSMSVGSGFVLSPDQLSPQIDLLIFDDTAPVIFKDGDFVVVPPDSVRAVIEVKTTLQASKIEDSLVKLVQVSKLLFHHHHFRRTWNDVVEGFGYGAHRQSPFLGLFSYNPSNEKPETVLESLCDLNPGPYEYPVSALSLGKDMFYRYWDREPQSKDEFSFDGWHAYNMPGLSAGYFVHNVMESLFPKIVARAPETWYPPSGKEANRVGRRSRQQQLNLGSEK